MLGSHGETTGSTRGAGCDLVLVIANTAPVTVTFHVTLWQESLIAEKRCHTSWHIRLLV